MTAVKRNDVLKLIALVTMLIDHIGYLFFPEILLFRTIGRIAFPIFAYQLALGFIHTSNRSRYAGRLAIFGALSAVPYAFFNPELNFDPLTLNIMFLLLMGAGAMALWERSISMWRQDKEIGTKIWSAVFFIAWGLWMLLPRILVILFSDVTIPYLSESYSLKLSYAGYGLWMMMIFYWFRQKAILMSVAYLIISILGPIADGLVAYAMAYMDTATITVSSVAVYCIENFSSRINDVLSLGGGIKSLNGFFFQSRSLLGLAVILLLGNRHFEFKMPRYIAYWFYPVHMTILMLVLRFIV